MALFGWIVAVIVCFGFTCQALFWWWWATHISSSKGEGICITIFICIIAFAWYKIFGWFPYEITAKPV